MLYKLFVYKMAFVVMFLEVMESVKTDVPNRSCHSGEKTHICDKCCAEFFTWTELSGHHEVCTEDPLVLIVKDDEGMPVPQESSTVSSPVPSIESSDLSAAESTDGGFELRHTVVNYDSVDNLEESPDRENFMELELCPHDKQPLNRSPCPPDTAQSSSLLKSGGTYSMPSTNVTLEILHSTRVAVAQFSEGLTSCGIGGKAASAAIPVILEHLLALQQQQVHQLHLIEQICTQVTFMNKHLPQAGFQLASTSRSVTPNPPGVITPALSGSMSSTVSEQAAVTLSSLPEKSQSPLIQNIGGKHTFRDVTSMSVSSENVPPSLTGSSSSNSSNADSQKNSTGCTQTLNTSSPLSIEQSHLLSSSKLTFVPQSPSNIVFPNPLASIATTGNAFDPLAALIKNRKGKPPNISLFKTKLSPEEPFFKHKCRFCAKVFGSDSALQIHLRSHTGERPFKCNICGNRFSTKGNLKVHFQRHKDKYPLVRMNPYPVPEYLDNVPTSSGIPYGMSILSEKTVFSWPNNKPVAATLPSTMSLQLSTPFTNIGGSNHSGSVTSPIKSPALFESLSFSSNHRDSEAVSVSRKSSLETDASDIDKTEGEYLLQNCSLTANLVTKAPISLNPSLAHTSEPFTSPHLVSCSSAHSFTSGETKHLDDSLQTSETSKLQQLVENIDKKITDPNQCILCHRILSCQSALKMHYRIHTGERPYKCNVCGRAFTTKGNLKAHIGIHRENPPIHVVHSCPICQKKFTNAVVLQQHIRTHMVSHIPDSTFVDGLQEMDINVCVSERNVDSFDSDNIHDTSMVDQEEDEEIEGMEDSINPSKPPALDCNYPKSSTNILSMAALENQMKMVDMTVIPNNTSGVKLLTNSFNDSIQFNAKRNLSQKMVENCCEIIPNMSELFSSPSASVSPIQRNSENVMIKSHDTYNRADSNPTLAVSAKRQQSDSAASSAVAAMSQDVTTTQAVKLAVREKGLYSTAFQQTREQGTMYVC